MKIKLKLTLIQTCLFVIAFVVLLTGGWILTLILVAFAVPLDPVPDDEAFINIDMDTRAAK